MTTAIRNISTSTSQSRAVRLAPGSCRSAAREHLRASQTRSVRPSADARPPTEVDPRIDRATDFTATAASMLRAMIEATGLTKRLGGRTVVSDVSFRCEPGTVTGFLGPNGAGKTTTMRMLVGLSTPDAGDSMVLDRDYHELPNPGRQVGVLLDASAQHPGPHAAARRWPSAPR